ncbi:hypothetical protein PCE1_001879 [Barthelona sp. PCE]
MDLIDSELNYIILEELGRGNQGVVYRAVSKDKPEGENEPQKEVALKIINLKRGEVPKSVENEIEALSQLNHPNILKFYQAYDLSHKENGTVVLAFEYVPNAAPVIDHHLSNFCLSPDNIRLILRDLISALYHSHQVGFAHRDIKPDNILYSTDGILKLIDFGLAAETEKMVNNMVGAAGSPAYMSPDQITYIRDKRRGRKPRALNPEKLDIWSVGVLMYTMLFGKSPFTLNDVSSLFSEILTKPIDIPNSFFNHPACNLLIGMLRRSSENRFGFEEILNHPWLTNNGTEPIDQYDLLELPATAKIMQACTDIVLMTRNSYDLKFPNFSLDMDHRIDFHSVFNVVNICRNLLDNVHTSFSAISTEKLNFEAFSGRFFPQTTAILQTVLDALNNSRKAALAALSKAETFITHFQAESEALLTAVADDIRDTEHSEIIKMSQVKQLLDDDILPILGKRVDEIIVRSKVPTNWVFFEANQLYNNMADVAVAITNNSLLTGSKTALITDPDEFKAYEGAAHYLRMDLGRRAPLDFVVMPPVMQDVMRDSICSARKFSTPGSTIGVKMFNSKRNLHLIIEDLGQGFSSNEEFQRIMQGAGAGVTFARSFGGSFGFKKAVLTTQFFNGTFEVKSAKEIGSQIHISLPMPPSGIEKVNSYVRRCRSMT